MHSLTNQEAREYVCSGDQQRKFADDDSLYWDVEGEPSFMIQAPTSYRELTHLAHELVRCSYRPEFPGALVWVRFMYAGTNPLIESGWLIFEDMRRAHGDLRPLEVAPAQAFRQDEERSVHVCLLTIMGNGWPATYVPSNVHFFIDFTSGHRLHFYSRSLKELDQLRSRLARWNPAEPEPVPTS